ncbi:MAG: DUF4445 domain-containing protein [Treponema sp.]|nr:DUF4445 domain-containing protein [Candidatus Treponema caballi]
MSALSSPDNDEIIFIADIGTTTIKASLVSSGATGSDRNSGALLASLSEKNAQSVFGLDVISRVLYAHHNGVEPLQKKVLSQVHDMLKALCVSADVQPESVSRSIITGNTIMLHLVRGLSVSGFEMAPFTPVSLGEAEEVLFGLPAYFPPCIDAFLGADAVCAALYAISAPEARFPLLLADVGTNTEIMLFTSSAFEEGGAGTYDKLSLTCCSTAAGPAFEGGVSGGRYTGSELVHMLAELLKAGTMDETGLLLEDADSSSASESGFLLAQNDIRQLQLAKGAVSAAVDTLLQEAGLSVGDVGSFVLCGNFGSALNTEEAERIGLFPEGLSSVARYAGNAAELGARLLVSDGMKVLAKKIAASGKLIQLADSRFFARRYIERMNFGS